MNKNTNNDHILKINVIKLNCNVMPDRTKRSSGISRYIALTFNFSAC